MAASAIAGGRFTGRSVSGRPIPKRGQVKVAIVVGLAHSLASIFSFSPRSSSSAQSNLFA